MVLLWNQSTVAFAQRTASPENSSSIHWLITDTLTASEDREYIGVSIMQNTAAVASILVQNVVSDLSTISETITLQSESWQIGLLLKTQHRGLLKIASTFELY
jgi:hypothetical protein